MLHDESYTQMVYMYLNEENAICDWTIVLLILFLFVFIKITSLSFGHTDDSCPIRKSRSLLKIIMIVKLTCRSVAFCVLDLVWAVLENNCS